MEELKPCPWCGKQPVVRPRNPKIQGDAWGEVICVNKRCAAQPYVGDGALQSHNRGSEAYKRSAIRRWNTRHTGAER